MNICLELQQEKEPVGKKNWGRADYDSMRAELRAIDWERLVRGKSAEEMWLEFKNVMYSQIENRVPVTKKQWKGKTRWITNNVIKLLDAKKRCWRQYKNGGTNDDRERYETIAKQVKKAIRKAKSKMERDIANKTDDGGKLFRNYIKSKTKNTQQVGPLIDDEGRIISGDEEMANCLNKFFSSVFTKENVTNIPGRQ